MEFRILGVIELSNGQHSRVLGPTKEGTLLASLAVAVGRPVPVDVLTNRLWDDRPPERAMDNLRTYVSRLRRIMAAVAGQQVGSTVKRAGAGAYVLDADPQSVDLHRHATLAAQARSLADSGEDGQALNLVDQADQLWLGEPLTGVAGQWAEDVRLSFARRRLALSLIRAGAALRRGHFPDIVGDLEALAVEHPNDEALAEHLMLALYGCGRPIEALDIYRRIREHLYEFGSDPGPRLRRLQQAILRQAPIDGLLPGGAMTDDRRFAMPVPNNLPRRTQLVGREAQMERIRSAVVQAQSTAGRVIGLEAIDGMGGVGKTVLATEAAHELRDLFPDGQFVVELRTHSGDQKPVTSALALDMLLRSFGVPPEKIPRDLDGAAALWRSVLAQRRALVILDDVADPAQILPLLPGESSSLVIATSRRRLSRLPGLRRVPLDVLSEEHAVALFRSRVEGTERTAVTSDVATIVRLCGYLPLAIEIVASRLNSHPLWTAADLARRLSDGGRLVEIRDGNHDITQLFAFSYRELTARQQFAFRQLGAYSGTEFGPHAAAALLGLPLNEAEHLIEDLLDQNLIQEPRRHRYRMHDLVREYARTLAAAPEHAGENAKATDRLLDFYLHVVDQADRLLFPHRPRIEVGVVYRPTDPPYWPDRAAAQDWLLEERSELLAMVEAAWVLGRCDRAALLTHAVGGALDAWRDTSAAERLHHAGVSHWRSTGHLDAEARSLIDLSQAHYRAAHYQQAITAAEQALALARRLGDDGVIAEALHQLALPHRNQGQPRKALALQHEALDIRSREGDLLQQARSHNNLAITLLHLGEYEAAGASFHAALAEFQGSGDESGAAHVRNNLGDLYRDTGDQRRARESYESALAFATVHGTPVDSATMQMNVADSRRIFGELEEALLLYRQVLPVFRSIGEKRWESTALTGIGATLRDMGQYDGALAHHNRALELAREIGSATEEAQALIELGLTEQRLGHLAVATIHVQSGLLIARRIGAARETENAQRILELIGVIGSPAGGSPDEGN
ncbi:tetratricopeptide repeat protein [Streptomyces sp. NPDC127098]|uniref:AfsR/SARP family transcriptional regulator n=1 Tax=Streptomyces sp. NPDC127098 TaxID=3347137 RepID=UPI0036612521